MSQLKKYLDAHETDIVGGIEQFVTRETPSTDKARLDAFATFLAKYAAEISGGKSEVVPAENSGNNVILRCGETDATSPVMLVGHYDTVWPVGTLNTMPFSIDDSIARGPGIFDMKAGLVQGLWAIRALRATDTPHRPIVFVFNSDEEIGSPESRPLIERHARDAHAALVLEPSFDGALKTERKGVGRYTIRVRGRAAHAGLDPKGGVSAIDELARLTLALHESTDLSLGTTVNVGVVRGGSRFNVIAEFAEAEIDLRIATMDEAQRMDALIKALGPHHAEAEVTAEGGIVWPPMKRNASIAHLFDVASNIASHELDLTLDEASVGGASDGCTCAALGIPVLDGLGAVGAGAHAVHEHIDIRHVSVRSALVAHLLSEL
ncbi:M20 family metallopeptidase [Salinisphaera aquimarina]|uniref:M20 family metallopeptidase n=1 Tax=Salinisphaera aquimarina TaxID=2094031 RepID=A0ABV7ELY4_9GAMM